MAATYLGAVRASRPQGPYALGWREAVRGELEVCRVPGHHWTMVYPPHVEVLAERMGRLLDEVGPAP